MPALSAKEIRNNREKYATLTTVVDTLDRVIKFAPLRPSEAIKIREMAPNLEGVETHIDESDGKSYEIPKSMPLSLAASVREIDGFPFLFPRTRGELDSVLDLLDAEGMFAIMKGMADMASKANAAAEVGAEVAKNLAETPAS